MRRATLGVLILAYALPAWAAAPPAGVIRVTATYPGADAGTVDETVLSALFRQITSVEDLTRIESEARNDGTGTITIHFHPKTDLDLAEMRVHNRVSLALPTIPEPCRQLGISVRKLPAGPPVFWLALTGEETTDEAFLRRYATVHLKPELAHIRGVADVQVVGVEKLGVWVRVKPDRLAAYSLTAGDVIAALRRENTPVAAGGSLGGRERQYSVTTSSRLKDFRQLEAVILRANADGEVLRLRDVARVELGAPMGGFTRINGKPAALIAVKAWPGKVSVEQLGKIEGVGALPPGMHFDLVADRSADRLLTVEVGLPNGASLERTEKIVAQVTDLIRALPGKPETVAVAEGYEPNAATILVKVQPGGGPTAADVDKTLHAIAGARIRVGDVPAGCEAFPVRIALTDPGELLDPGKQREERLREAADLVVQGLVRDRAVAEPAAFPSSAAPQYAIDVDRDKCAALGVEPNDLFTTLQMTLGGAHATDLHKYGQAWKVTVQAEPQYARTIEDLAHLRVRSAAGKMVPLETVVKVRKADGPATVVRVNGYRAMILTAAPAAGQTPAEAAARCIKLAREVLPRGYRVKDLTGP